MKNLSNELVWRVETRQVKELVVWKENPRKLKKGDLEKLMERIKQRGFHAVIVIDTDNTILSGNQRKIALVKLNVTEVNVLVPNRKLSEEERRKIAFEDNLHDGQWDMEKLKTFEMDFLSDIGMSDMDLSKIWEGSLEAENDEFNVSEEIKKIKEPKTRKGDLIIFDKHKLLCADATDSNAVKALFGDDRASMIYSDPNFNIGLDYDKGVGNKSSYGGKVDDNRSAEDYKEFIRKTLVNALSVSKKDVHCFYWCDEAWVWVFQTLFNENGIKNRRLNIWLKNNSSPCPNTAFNKIIEVCCYGTIGSPYLCNSLKNLNEVMNKELTTGNKLFEDVTNVLAVKRLPSSEYEHPTTKPPSLHEKPILRCSKVNDIIFDSFSGSFSTAICAEQLHRRVYSLEISEIFCDLAIRRWEKMTGKKVKVIHNFYEK